MSYIRFESTTANARGTRTGIFGRANHLARSRRLTPADRAWWRASNDSFDRAHPDPAVVDPTLFDRAVHPAVSCWFHQSATHLLNRIPGHLDLLNRYEIDWVERRSARPGRVLYRDPVQIVVAPFAGPTPTAAPPA